MEHDFNLLELPSIVCVSRSGLFLLFHFPLDYFVGLFLVFFLFFFLISVYSRYPALFSNQRGLTVFE